MTKHLPAALLWAPRVLTILFALFLSVFALDVFQEGKGFLETLVHLVLHLVPTLAVMGLLFVAWRREWIAGLIFGALAAMYGAANWGRVSWTRHVAITGPLLLISVLFFLSWQQRVRARKREPQAPGAG